MRRVFRIFLCVMSAVFSSVAAFCADEPPQPQPRALTAEEQAAEHPASEQPAWHAENAHCRLIVELDTPDVWMFLDDRVLCLPDTMEQTVCTFLRSPQGLLLEGWPKRQRLPTQ